MGARWSLAGQLGSAFEAHGFKLQHCHVLGTLEAGRDLPATVEVILEDLEAEAPEAPEGLWALEVDDQGAALQAFPPVVFDQQERLRYGAEFLTAVQETGITAKALVVRGLRLEDPAC